jgi:hypothetical protein
MSDPLRLLPNFGAEEGAANPGGESAGPERAVAECWHALFAPGTLWHDDAPTPAPTRAWKAPTAAVFDWLDAAGGLAAWLNSEAAGERAAALGCALTGATPEIVRRVHDKGFAHAVAVREGLLPVELARTIAVLDPEDLRDPEAAVACVAAALATWPVELRRRFTLKPRFGSSGRGRVAGVDGVADTRDLRGAARRLAERGGALLEPWCDRIEDLSASFFVAENRDVLLLGTTRQWLTPAGVYRGQRGTIDKKGRVTSGSDRDEALREAGAAVAHAAAKAGYFGPCGLDAFSYRSADGDAVFRPVVEWNARFTMGIVAIGLLRRARTRIVSAFSLGAGERLAFHFGLTAPPGGWSAPDALLKVFPLRRNEPDSGPALVLSRDPAILEQRLGESPV